MQAGIFFRNGNLPGKGIFPDAVEDGIALIPVIFSHAIDMFFKITLAEKARQRILLEIGNCAGIKAQFSVKPSHEPGRQDHVTDSDSGRQAFRKCIDIDDFLLSIDALQSGKRTPSQTEFAVVVILNYEAVF